MVKNYIDDLRMLFTNKIFFSGIRPNINERILDMVNVNYHAAPNNPVGIKMTMERNNLLVMFHDEL